MRLLPVTLLAIMLAIATLIEAVAYPPIAWLPKLPLAVLLALPFVPPLRRDRRDDRGRDRRQ